MEQQRFSPLLIRGQALPPVIVVIAFASYFSLNVVLVFLMANSALLGIIGMIMINLIAFFFLQPRWSIPLYILIGAPSIAIPLGSIGILSRLFVGNLMLALVIMIGLVRTITSQRRSQQPLLPTSLLIPLVAVVLVGLASIIYSRLQPDPRVVYSYPHFAVPLILVNIMEMVLLVGLPVVLMIVPALIRTARDVQWIVRAFIGIGMLYALGTIFAGPLGLYSQEVILGQRRPQVLGETSSVLGMLLVFFTCIALSQALYAPTRSASFRWWLFTIIFSIAVIMSFGRESWIALCLSGLVMIGFRTRSVVVLLVIQVFLLSLLVPGVTDFFNPEKVYGIDRLIIWQDAITIWRGHPYFGVGAGNYQFFDIAYGADVAGVAHNQFLEVLAEMGVQGFLCLLWSIVAMGRFTFQRFSAATTSQGKAISLAFIGYYITLIFAGFFADTFLPSVAGAGGTSSLVGVSYQWLLLGLVITIPQWEKSVSTQDAVESGQPMKGQPQLARGERNEAW